MITSQNSTNTSKYEALFNKATIALLKCSNEGEELSSSVWGISTVLKATEATEEDFAEGVYFAKILDSKGEPDFAEVYETEYKADLYIVPEAINTLQQYFSHLSTLSLYKPEVFTRIPTDEPIFDINANTRTITVPDDFKKNGVGVVGDKRAEYIWFRIRRFYDSMDLSLLNCRVEWKANKKEGISSIWGYRPSSHNGYDLISEPGYIIFGWCLEDLLTEVAGNITFSIRFYKEGTADQTLAYSFGTQTATVAIKAGTGYGMNTANYSVDENAVADYNRFENSKIVGDADKEPGDAIWTPVQETYWSTSTNNQDDIWPENGGLPEAINLMIPTNLYLTTSASSGMHSEVPVEALIPLDDNGGSIVYKWTYYDEDNNASTIVSSSVLIEVPADEIKDGKGIDGKAYYTRTINRNGEPINTLVSGDLSTAITYYEKVSVGRFDKIGTYKATAVNRFCGISNENTFAECVVPAPQEPEFEDYPSKAILTGDDESTEIDESAVTISASSKITNKYPQLPAGAMSYQWEKHYETNSDEVTWTAIDGATDREYTATEEAYYRVLVKNTLNNRVTDGVYSKPCRITKAPLKPVITRNANDTDIRGGEVKVTASVFDANRSNGEDGIRYTWFEIPSFSTSFIPADIINASTNGRLTWEYDEEKGTCLFKYPVTTSDGETETTEQKEIAPLGTVVDNGDAENPNVFKQGDRDLNGEFIICLVTNVYNGEEASDLSQFYQFPKTK